MKIGIRLLKRQGHFGFLVLLFPFLLTNSALGHENSQAISYREQMRAVNGTELFTATAGVGEPILVVHGGPGLNHSYFMPHLDRLAEGSRLIFFDQRASGRSSPTVAAESLRMATLVADIEALRKNLGLGKVHLMAHSWGGVLALFYAIEHPDSLQSLILVNPIGASTEFRNEAAANLLERITEKDKEDRQQLRQSEAYTNGDMAAYAKLFQINFRATFADRKLTERLQLQLEPDYLANSKKLATLFQDLTEYDLHPQLDKITVPTLIIHGADDPTPLQAAKKISDFIPSSQLVVLEKCGHFPFIEQPEDFFRHVSNFLSQTGK